MAKESQAADLVYPLFETLTKSLADLNSNSCY